MKPNSSLPRPPGRHLTEKNRRQQMKALYHHLASLVSRKHVRYMSYESCRHKVVSNIYLSICFNYHVTYIQEKLPAFELLGEATNYIKRLEKNVSELKAKKDSLQRPVVIIAVNESERDGECLEINSVWVGEQKPEDS